MTLRIEVERREATTLIVLRGDLDAVTAPDLRAALVEAIGPGVRIVIDMEAVEFLDSAGLGILVGGLKRARTNDGEIELVVTSRDVMRPLEITGLDRSFTLHRSREDALQPRGD